MSEDKSQNSESSTNFTNCFGDETRAKSFGVNENRKAATAIIPMKCCHDLNFENLLLLGEGVVLGVIFWYIKFSPPRFTNNVLVFNNIFGYEFLCLPNRNQSICIHTHEPPAF